MKKVVRWFFRLAPLLLLALVIADYGYQNVQLNRFMRNADGLVIGTGAARLTVQVKHSMEDELSRDVLTVLDSQGKTVLAQTIIMDHDLYGVGFVKAMQVDDDPELEVLVWGNGMVEAQPYFLDFNNGTVQQRPFAEVSPATRNIVLYYQYSQSEFPILLGVILFSLPLYYLLYFIVSWIIRRIIKPTPATP